MNDDSVIAFGHGLLSQIEKSEVVSYKSKLSEKEFHFLISEEFEKSAERFRNESEVKFFTGTAGKEAFEKSLSEAFKNPEKIFEMEFIKRALKTDWCFDMLESEREEMAKKVFDALQTGVHFTDTLESILVLTPLYEMLKKASTLNAPITRGRKNKFITFEEA